VLTRSFGNATLAGSFRPPRTADCINFGTSLSVSREISAAGSARLALAAAEPVAGYFWHGSAFQIREHNPPETFGHPVWSLISA